jgi:hypothetical protein
MKALASALLLIAVAGLSSPGPRFAQPLRSPVDHLKNQQARKGGQWYLAENGHAVYCFGPVMVINEPNVGFQRVATFCQGDRPMVPLKD